MITYIKGKTSLAVSEASHFGAVTIILMIDQIEVFVQ